MDRERAPVLDGLDVANVALSTPASYCIPPLYSQALRALQ